MTRVIHEPVLVLNRNWQPVAFLSVGVAITTVVRDMGWVVHPETYELLDFERWCESAPPTERVIKTSSGRVPAPETIVLSDYDEQPRRGVSFSRKNLYRRDDYTCQYCGGQPGIEALTVDHVHPRSQGGPTSWENCVVACEPCNSRKADHTLREAGLILRTVPRRPRWKPRISVHRGHYRPGWEPFVRKANIEVELVA